MELRDLRCFLAVADELSFTKAAVRLGMAQPALSLRIKEFERELDAELFARTKRSVALSSAGTVLLPLARQILTSSEHATRTVRRIGLGQSGELRIGAFYSAIYTVLPQIIQRFASKYPDVEIQIKELIVTEQLRMLRSGAIDVGVVRLEQVDDDLRTIRLLREDYICALHIDHKLAKRARVSLRDLESETLITLDPQFNADFYATTYAAFANEGLSPRIINKAPDMHLVLGLVSAGLGVAIVPSSLAQINHKFIAFRPLANKLPKITMQLAWLAENASPIIPHFVKAAQDIR
jgi:DNA-binding transcriptional LysR family regulator